MADEANAGAAAAVTQISALSRQRAAQGDSTLSAETLQAIENGAVPPEVVDVSQPTNTQETETARPTFEPAVIVELSDEARAAANQDTDVRLEVQPSENIGIADEASQADAVVDDVVEAVPQEDNVPISDDNTELSEPLINTDNTDRPAETAEEQSSAFESPDDEATPPGEVIDIVA